jgi:hypothetical protein
MQTYGFIIQKKVPLSAAKSVLLFFGSFSNLQNTQYLLLLNQRAQRVFATYHIYLWVFAIAINHISWLINPSSMTSNVPSIEL